MAQMCTFKKEGTFQYEVVYSQNIVKKFTTWAAKQIHKISNHGSDKKETIYSIVLISDLISKLLYVWTWTEYS